MKIKLISGNQQFMINLYKLNEQIPLTLKSQKTTAVPM